jgi:hypothetical protein
VGSSPVSDTGNYAQCPFIQNFLQAAVILGITQRSPSGLGGSLDSSADTSTWIEIWGLVDQWSVKLALG